MRKIPTIFVRDWAGTLGPPGRFLLPEPHPECGWVFAGEGVPTRKLDGTCCLVADGKLFKRYEIKPDKRTGAFREPPPDFVSVYVDEETGATTGWLPVGEGPEDKRHVEAFVREIDERGSAVDGTYELVGPKVNGNPEKIAVHVIIPHAEAESLHEVPTGFDELKEWLRAHDFEGVVWHHPDGRMAKIKGKDFGLRRPE